MDVASLEIEAVRLIRPRRFPDKRGYFVETWNQRAFEAAGIAVEFVQDNVSFSGRAGTIRGLHFQKPPAAQAKLIRAVRGSIFDVAVDLRSTSGTFGRYVSAVLTAEAGEQLYIPVGFAHGFCTLEPDTEVAYKTSAFYSPAQEGGIAWDDPELAIAWPELGAAPQLSAKDAGLPRLAEIAAVF